ncbi:hypothetical protein [Archangium sp.]|uniref:hypothetical protein n=1 Tax=Archangium sp. TaxID=1872627 RepID=UPI00389AA1AD
MFLGASGCQPEAPGEDALGAAPAAAKQGMRVANSLTTQALVLNALSTNPTASPLLVSTGLVPLFNPVSGNSYLQLQLRDVDAQHFMSYLVSCALESGHAVTWKDPLTLAVKTWQGQAGLCPQWETGAPTQACKNRVSACLLARNNAYGRRVELSMRGEDPARPALFALETETRPVEIDPDTASRVPSYETCTTPQTSMNRDCGWKADFIGRCTPGQTVRLGAGGKAPDQCTSSSALVLGSASGARMMLRVCDNTLGCDQGSTRQLGQSQGTCATTNPAVSFTCPASGFFNVMAAPYDSTQVGTVSVGVETGTSANTRYRLSEAEVYPVREGAYYGNIFDASALAATVYVEEGGRIQGKEQVVKGAVYKKMFSCQAPEWSDAAAYATHRVCALPGSESNCAARSTGVCIDWTNRGYPASKCGKDDGTVVDGDGDFEECYDSYGEQWKEPVTVFLHETCGMPGIPSNDCAWRGTTK